ncbi:MAG: thioredoxin [Myxococcales bacterium]|nr:thioredoxin [Myxococcales bacterium]
MKRVCPGCAANNRIPLERLGDRPKCGRCKAPLPSVDAPIALKSEAEFDALIGQRSLPVLVDFWAAWCGPCRMVAPEVTKLAQARAGHLLVAKVDTEALPGIARRFEISGIPTIILYRDGAEAKRISGAMSAERIARALDLPVSA